MAIIDTYTVTSEGVNVVVNIGKSESGLNYSIKIPEVGKPTSVLLLELKKRLITEVTIGTSEILDPKVMIQIKERFTGSCHKILDKLMPGLLTETKDFLTGTLMHDMLGLGQIEFLLEDVSLEEIVINSSTEPVRVYHKKYGWLETNITVVSEAQILNYANIIARRVGRQITTLSPLLDAHLVTGDRSNAVLYPISHKGNTITIRKFARDPWTVTDLIKNNTCTAKIFALLWLAIQYELNILISGGTGSGKTSFLNVIMPFIPSNHRILSIEDTRELQLPKFLYWAPLTVRPPNPEGKGEVTMLDLLINSLRMRPDRIILGEIRKQEQAQVLFEAMHTGHSVYATVHADSISETIRRLVNPPISVPQNLLTAVNLNVVMFRDRRKGIRRVYQIGEYVESEEGKTIRPNILYRWRPTDDTIVPHVASLRLYDDLSMHTGLSQQELLDDLAKREKILNWMVRKNIRKVDDVGEVIHRYYIDPDSIFKK
ncbi:MAG: ATPase, T2SS/T4P/T4SS family [Candidatus Woesearchaeota archaeon]